MADSGILESTEESELDVLPKLDSDDKDTLTFSTSHSHELLVDVNEVVLGSLFSLCNHTVSVCGLYSCKNRYTPFTSQMS